MGAMANMNSKARLQRRRRLLRVGTWLVSLKIPLRFFIKKRARMMAFSPGAGLVKAGKQVWFRL